MAMKLEQKVARLKLVADGLRRIQEFESARYLDEYAAWLTQPAQAVDVTDADVEAAGAAYFEQQWDVLPPRSKAIYRNALRRALKSFATRALSAEKAGWRDMDSAPIL